MAHNLMVCTPGVCLDLGINIRAGNEMPSEFLQCFEQRWWDLLFSILEML
jgi:hypothetical protein